MFISCALPCCAYVTSAPTTHHACLTRPLLHPPPSRHRSYGEKLLDSYNEPGLGDNVMITVSVSTADGEC
jgi:hypothetical protein